MKLFQEPMFRTGHNERRNLDDRRIDSTNALQHAPQHGKSGFQVRAGDGRPPRPMVVNPHDVVPPGEDFHDLMLARGIVVPRTRQADDDASFDHAMVSHFQVGRGLGETTNDGLSQFGANPNDSVTSRSCLFRNSRSSGILDHTRSRIVRPARPVQ